MIHLFGLVYVLGTQTGLTAKSVLMTPADGLLKIVGPQDMSVRREFGMTLIHKGFNKVWVDAAGAKMKQARFGSDRLMPWRQYLAQLGLDGARASSHPETVPPSPLPRLRSKLTLTGVRGLPSEWQITYVEYALANKDRLRKMKTQINSAPVGAGRNKLIMSCYDWFSELDFSRS